MASLNFRKHGESLRRTHPKNGGGGIRKRRMVNFMGHTGIGEKGMWMDGWNGSENVSGVAFRAICPQRSACGDAHTNSTKFNWLVNWTDGWIGEFDDTL